MDSIPSISNGKRSISLPYGKDEILIPVGNDGFNDSELNGKMRLIRPKLNLQTLILPQIKQKFMESMENPISSKSLGEILNKKGKIAVVVDDHTRKIPFDILLPIFFDYLNKMGVNKSRIIVFVACGTHLPPTESVMQKMFGNYLDEYEWVISSPEIVFKSLYNYKYLGTTSRGTEVKIHDLFLKCPIKIIFSDITFHYFAGFGGGRKSIFPGLASPDSINQNHRMATYMGVAPAKLKGNPVHEDMEEAANFIDVDFAINCCISPEGDILNFFSGDLHESFDKAAHWFKNLFQIHLPIKADTLILSCGGHPYDLNYYQALKALHHCHNACKVGGTIIFITECPEKIGNSIFELWAKKYSKVEDVKLAITNEFQQGGNSLYFQLKFATTYSIFLFSSLDDFFCENNLKMKKIPNTKELVRIIEKKIKNSRLTYIIPDGSKVLVVN